MNIKKIFVSVMLNLIQHLKRFRIKPGMTKTFFIIFILLILTVQPAKAITESTMARSYMLGPNDVFSIMVYDFPEFDQKDIRVAPDGNIVLAGIGIFNVTGMTLSEFHDFMHKKLQFYLKDPQVTIKLEKIKPIVVYINGAVEKPGSYEFNIDAANFLTSQKSKSNTFIERRSPLLSSVLAAAGGIKYNADLENITIKNSLNNTEIQVNLLELLKGDTNQDIFLIANDIVNIPELPTSYSVSDEKYKKYSNAVFSPDNVPVKVLGYVQKPGLVSLDTSYSLNLNSAISSAGGYYDDEGTPYPPEKVYISRVDHTGQITTLAVNPMNNDIMLRPNDIIYVPDKTSPIIKRAFNYLNRLITPFNNFGSTYNNWAQMFHPTRNQIPQNP